MNSFKPIIFQNFYSLFENEKEYDNFEKNFPSFFSKLTSLYEKSKNINIKPFLNKFSIKNRNKLIEKINLLNNNLENLELAESFANQTFNNNNICDEVYK